MGFCHCGVLFLSDWMGVLCQKSQFSFLEPISCPSNTIIRSHLAGCLHCDTFALYSKPREIRIVQTLLFPSFISIFLIMLPRVSRCGPTTVVFLFCVGYWNVMCHLDTATWTNIDLSGFCQPQQVPFSLLSGGFISFFQLALPSLCHTPYAIPWIYTPSAIYGLLRVIRYQLSDQLGNWWGSPKDPTKSAASPSKAIARAPPRKIPPHYHPFCCWYYDRKKYRFALLIQWQRMSILPC